MKKRPLAIDSISVDAPGMLGVGDKFSIDLPDTNKFRRFFYWLCFRKPPKRRHYYVVTHEITSTNLKIKPL
mgnify:CR=1 FL=1